MSQASHPGVPAARRALRVAAAALTLYATAAVQAQAPADPFNYSRTSSFSYRADGLLESETVEPDNAASCVTTSYLYDASGNKSSATTANCAGASGGALFTSRTNTSTYAAVASQPILVAGASVNVAVPAGLFATSAKNALNQSETREYDPRFGALTKLIGPNQLPTTVQVDDFGRKVKEVRADGTSTVSFYCVLTGKGLDTIANSAGCGSTTALSGQPSEIPVDAISYVHTEVRNTGDTKMAPASRVYSDRAGRKLREIVESFDGPNQPAGRRHVVKDTQYNAQGVAVLSTQPYFLGTDSSTTAGASDVGLTLTTYDALGRPTQLDVADPQGNVPGVDFNSRGTTRTSARTTISYRGLTTTTVNPKGQSRTEEKNADGKLVRVSDAYGGQIAHQHDAFGNLIQTKDALQNLIAIAYDIRGRKLSMSDPDTGLWQYDYNAVGELVWQQSPNQRLAGSSTTMAYDVLGRMSSRAEPEFSSSWSYDACSKGVGKLCESNTSHGVNKKLYYDNLGRPSASRTTISSGPSFATALTYQIATGRVETQTYPTGLKVQYVYTAVLGFLNTVTSSSAPNGTLWTAGTVNAWGKAETQSLGNGVISRAAFDAATGRVTSASAGAGSATNVLDHRYRWDSLNNLSARVDDNGDGNTGSVNETFQYDNLNRLTQYTVAAPQIPNLAGLRSVTLVYNAIGNILYKSDVGNYDYAPYGNTGGVSNPRPHAVSQVVGTNLGSIGYSYDANGNMTAASGGKYRSVSYTSFNLPDSNTGLAGPGGSPRYAWQYDENHQRIKEVRTSTAGTRTTWSQHPDNQGGLGFESESGPGGAVSNRHYLSVGGQTVVLVSSGALPVLGAGATAPPAVASIALVKVEYWHKDHLGSLVATTDQAGNVTARYAYDPFGKRRMSNGRYDEFGTLVIDWASDGGPGTDRGFTGHEHLDDVGIVHMNGRLYDPTIGRFLQGDPFLQDLGNLQNYNRYGYCYNNPMGCVDPSGYFSWKRFFRAAAAIAIAVFAPEIFAALGGGPSALVSLTYTTGAGVSATLTGWGAATAGFFSGAIAGGSFKSGVQGAFSAGLFFEVGQIVGNAGLGIDGSIRSTSEFAGAVAMHGVAGCISSVAGGGKCGPGALSAAFSKASLPLTAGLEDGLGRTFAHAVVGGTASQIGGGKFSNGAMTGAFSYLFNYCSNGKCSTKFEQGMYDWWPGYKAGTLLYNQTMGDGSWTGWELLDAASVGLGVAGKGLQLFAAAGREIQLVDGFYQAEGSAFKFSKYYYERLWETGRGAPFLQAQEVLTTATHVTVDRMAGFYRYTNAALEMVYNPTTKEVWHLQPLKR